jgi:arsenate reductase
MKTTWLLVIAVLFAAPVFAQSNQVVFVCEHGSAKSVIAAAYFNKLAKERNISWHAVSRGTNPDAEISPKTRKLLTSEDLLDNSVIPQKISQADVDASQTVILFYPLPEHIKSGDKTLNWLEIRSMNDDYLKLRDDIVSKVIPLIDALAKR